MCESPSNRSRNSLNFQLFVQQLEKIAINPSDVIALTSALSQAAKESPQALVVISADAHASHQSVIQVLEAAQISGLQRITFSAQARTSTTVLP